VVESQSDNKTEEKRLGTDLFTEFVQRAFKSGSLEDFDFRDTPNSMKILYNTSFLIES
jgi:hypothetical protein